MRIFDVGDVDVGWVGLTVRGLGRLDGFPLSFRSGGSSSGSLGDMLP